MKKEKKVEDELPAFKNLLSTILREEIIDWKALQQTCSSLFQSVTEFAKKKEDGMKVLHDCTVNHNIRIISRYYTRVTLLRLETLLDLNAADAESYLSKLVADKNIYAKIDRVAGIVTFVPPREPSTNLNEWSQNISSLLNLVERTCHIINKENMLHKVGVTPATTAE